MLNPRELDPMWRPPSTQTSPSNLQNLTVCNIWGGGLVQDLDGPYIMLQYALDFAGMRMSGLRMTTFQWEHYWRHMYAISCNELLYIGFFYKNPCQQSGFCNIFKNC